MYSIVNSPRECVRFHVSTIPRKNTPGILFYQIEDLSSRPVLARTTKVLLDLSHHGQDSISRSLHSNNEIAALVSSVPGAISRSLKNIRQMGLIECSRNRITIMHVDEVIKLAQIEPMELSTSPTNTSINHRSE